MHAKLGNQLADTLRTAGLSVALTVDQSVKVTPASNLTPELRDLIKTNKPALVAWLKRPRSNDPANSANLHKVDPDRSCWPFSPAMNTGEIDRFTARLVRFTDREVTLEDAERLADRLVIRDRERDDRAMCLECTHLQQGRRCGNWQWAGVAIRTSDAQLAGDFVRLLQRCDGFKKDKL